MPGRHRKQSNTRLSAAKVTAAGALLGGAGMALAAPSANAATDAQWEQVAACESSGVWSLNTGNGYHGGLQFSPSTWNAYGGRQYAPVAHQATKAQQIAIAEKVLAGQGKGAWSSCGKNLGAPTPRTAPKTPAPTPKVSKPAPKPAPKQTPKVTKPGPKVTKPAPKPAPKVTEPGGAASSFAQQIIDQSQAGGQQLDPAVLSAMQRAVDAGY
ncbi:transglycosylase family protein [Tsukamurella sp. 1534]|uniref:transglycosylase family protein n=1 Tax=Tsukamurella sp. 1534 TaxID=1151061 RepID=UPI0002EBA19B|nr:transglycosylase family protein [Tsukamurella sp. 1534]